MGLTGVELHSYQIMAGECCHRVKFKYKLASEDTSAGREVIECEHGERQEVMRDMQNKIGREDIDTLQRHQAFKNEKIVKVLAREGEGVTKMYIMTDAGYVYAY